MYSFKKRNGVNKMDSKRVGHEMSVTERSEVTHKELNAPPKG